MDDDYLTWTDSSIQDEPPAEKIKKQKSIEESRQAVRLILQEEKPAIGHLSIYMMEEVATGRAPNPFFESPLTERSLRLLLEQFFKYHTIMAFRKLTGINQEIPTEWKESITKVNAINEEICCAIEFIGSYSVEMSRCWRSHCRKFFIRDKHFTATVGSDFVTTDEELAKEEFVDCMAPDCEVNKQGTCHIVFESGMYTEELEFVETPDRRKIVSFCRDHMIFFEIFHFLTHMRWNVYLNCKTMIEKIIPQLKTVVSDTQIHTKIPLEFYEQLTVFYMARYNMLWCFGKPSDWKKQGFGLVAWLNHVASIQGRGKLKYF